jgi:predicted unusual protein kinase regulating ubiquinone biosynthesis (AarF/ABC1/UbiB family)
LKIEGEGGSMTDEMKLVEKIAAMEVSVSNVEKVVNKLDQKLDTWQATYPSRNEIEMALQMKDKEIVAVKERTSILEGHVTWLWRTIMGGGILAFVGGCVGLIFYLLKGGGE